MSSFQTLSKRPEYSPLSIARMLWKARILATVVWLLLAAVTLTIVHLIPATYKAETLILVDSQKIPERYVSPTVNADVQDRLATINQRILSSTRLKKIVEDFQLYREERKSKVEEEILDMMRDDIEVRLERGWTGNRPGAFRIAYKARVPALAADVANRLASLYIEENLRTREVQAEGTSEFLETQLQEAKKRLDELEKTVSGYKLRFNGELPEQQATLAGTLGRLHTELQGAQDAINRAQQSRLMLENALSMAEAAETALRPAAAHGSADIAADTPAQPAAKRSERLAAQLEAMRVRYSDEYPDMKRLAAELETVKKQEQQEGGGRAAPRSSTAASASEPVEVLRARQRTSSIRAQLGLIDRELAARTADRQTILRQITVQQAHLDRLPVREQEMASLTRDYEMSKVNYRSLLEKKLSAEMATEMERRQKAERFTVLDPARVPEKPYSPNRILLGGVGCGLALAIVVAASVALEMRKGLVLGEWELPGQIPVLGRVPRFGSASDGRVLRFLWRRRASVPGAAGKGAV